MKIGFRMVLILIILGMIIGVLLDMNVSGGVNAQPVYVPPVPTQTPLQIEMEIKNSVADFWLWILIKWGFALTALAALLWIIVRFLVVPARKLDREMRTDKSGLYAVTREWVPDMSKPWYVRPFAPKKLIMNDPNTAMAPDRMISLNDGDLKVEASIHGFNTEQQARYARGRSEIQKTSGMNALGEIQKMPGGAGKKSQADYMAEAGVFDERMKEAEARRQRAELAADSANLRNQRLLSGPSETGEPIGEAPAVEYLTFRESVEQSTNSKWLIGQATTVQPRTRSGVDVSVNGKIMTVDPTKTHLAILGGTGGGKTESSAFGMVYHARRSGYHVIVLDGKRGIDWKPLDGVVEWYDLRSGNLHGYMKQIMGIYEERSEYLQGLEGVNNIYQDKSGTYQPILLILEEFGNTWRKLGKSNAAQRDEVETWMDELFSMGRACGIILCLIDQAPQSWSAQMRSNAKFSVVYSMNGSAANEFKEYHVDQLETGYFSRNNVFYRAWHVADEVDLVDEFDSQPGRMLGVVKVEQTQDETDQPISKKKAKSQPVTQSQTPVSEVIDETPTEVPYPMRRIYDRDKELRNGKWVAFTEKALMIEPELTVIKLAQYMALAEDGAITDDSVNRRKSQASKWLNALKTNQPPPEPAMIGGVTQEQWQSIPI